MVEDIKINKNYITEKKEKTQEGYELMKLV